MLGNVYHYRVLPHALPTHTHTHTHTAGMRLPVVEGQATTIEIPKGTSDLGLGISWCEDQVRTYAYSYTSQRVLSVCVVGQEGP